MQVLYINYFKCRLSIRYYKIHNYIHNSHFFLIDINIHHIYVFIRNIYINIT